MLSLCCGHSLPLLQLIGIYLVSRYLSVFQPPYPGPALLPGALNTDSLHRHLLSYLRECLSLLLLRLHLHRGHPHCGALPGGVFPLLVPGEGEEADGEEHHPPVGHPGRPPGAPLQHHQVHCDISSRNILKLIATSGVF